MRQSAPVMYSPTVSEQSIDRPENSVSSGEPDRETDEAPEAVLSIENCLVVMVMANSLSVSCYRSSRSELNIWYDAAANIPHVVQLI